MTFSVFYFSATIFEIQDMVEDLILCFGGFWHDDIISRRYKAYRL